MPTTLTRPADTRPDVTTSVPGPPSVARPAKARDLGRPRTMNPAVVAAVLAVVLVAFAWVLARPATDVPATTTVGATTVSEDEALRRLVAAGYIPAEAWDADAAFLAELQRRGLVPDVAIPPPLYTPEEQMVIRLVRAGQLPSVVLESEVFVTKGLVNRGLIPAEAVR